MVTINVKLALVAIIIVPFLVWLISYSNMKMSAAWGQMYGNIADVNSWVEDSVSGARVVQSFTNEQYEIDQFNKNNQFFRKTKLRAYMAIAISVDRCFHMCKCKFFLFLYPYDLIMRYFRYYNNDTK